MTRDNPPSASHSGEQAAPETPGTSPEPYFQPLNWRARLAAQLDARRRRKEQERETREEFAAARTPGVDARHRSKLARLQQERETTGTQEQE